MIIRGAPIDCDGHGGCGLFFIPIFLHSPATLAASSFFFCSVLLCRSLAVLSCPEGKSRKEELMRVVIGALRNFFEVEPTPLATNVFFVTPVSYTHLRAHET